MGCDNCINLNFEQEIISKKETSNSLIKDIESQDIKLTEQNKNNNFSTILSISTKKSQKIQEDKFNCEVLAKINRYRFKHGVEELTLDEDISKISQRYAEKLARESELELSGNKYQGKELGEIIFTCYNNITPKELVDIWYKQGSKNYNYKKEPKISNNFTQLIWKNSKFFGIGHILTREDKLYIVANFYPEGNIKGQFLKNIFPITKKTEENDSFYSSTTTFLEEALFAHNELRLKHNAPPLILNPNLSILAQAHAETLAKEKKMVFSNNKLKNEKIGENLYKGTNNCNGEEVSSFWYKGNKKYNFKNVEKNDFNDSEINFFTQMIWKNTKEVGFGFYNDAKGNFYVVANYFPCGNIQGEYQNNVFPH